MIRTRSGLQSRVRRFDSDPRLQASRYLSSCLAGVRTGRGSLLEYRVGDYRIICDLQEAPLPVLAAEVPGVPVQVGGEGVDMTSQVRSVQ